MLRFGPNGAPLVIALLPLFEEANRTRTFAVGLLRRLAARGIAGILPDLPGQGESALPTAAVRLADLCGAVAAVAAQAGAPLAPQAGAAVAGQAGAAVAGQAGAPVFTLGIRSGALLDPTASVAGRWQLAPVTGDDLIREQARVAAAGAPAGMSADTPTDTLAKGPGESVEIAGNRIARALFAELRGVMPATGASRIVRLDTDPRPADLKLPAPPLWRRTEPGDDPALAALLADDIAAWIGSRITACAG